METSPTVSAIAEALSKFQKAVPAVKKDGTNPHFKSKFATLENLIETIREPLAANDLSFVQMPTGENELATIIMHKSGEWIKSTAKMELAKHDPQGQGSAITYMRRYSLSAALGLATEEDDDGNAAIAPAKRAAAPAPKPAPKPIDDKALLDAEKSLTDTTTLAELSEAWKKIPAGPMKDKLAALKDDLKKRYENA